MGLFGTQKAVAWALVRGLAGGSLFGSCSACLAVSHLHGSRATIPTRFSLMLQSTDPPETDAGTGNQMGAWCCDLNPVVWLY